ncbi:MAG: hypothetical protein ACLGHX_01195 [Acidimicrobiia bacterium]
MRPAIATVVGPGWEPQLVSHARTTGLARLVGRSWDFASLVEVASRADAIFIGSDVPWLADVDLRLFGDRTRIVGVASDSPGAALLDRAGAHQVLEATTPPAGLLAAAMSCLQGDDRQLIEVTGPRGAPGRSEVALAMAWESGACLIEADRAAPSLGLRMALPPDHVRRTHERDGLLLSPEPIGVDSVALDAQAIETLGGARRTTILDAGPGSVWHRSVSVEVSVIVGEATDVGIVRLARLCEHWLGPTPLLVVNRHTPDQNIRNVIRATGLEPAAVIPSLPTPVPGAAPMGRMRAAVAGLVAQRTAL